ncbi:elongation of very long chain fatty acids protein-like [Diabrotica virgifera virgifera]|uniref:Elongation of very long chain fatty acids protein n=1 Tax=Diabrotica virgifera virgifera TaxID=50390 RepID=A0ABM5JN72_DIAVI|nr:elongation of very long chain fatty acids protein-like [Diabrotica virgifera virgifera]XP_050499387.1 elongation of very long chain fatty acids protein-like [Diabrotica virgifera virgifera]XP_050499388.1 elongation of very long chain fatty acids protein-like [Diabrotica virgifera virgifera]XP_050499389.1 elongation of very long chain fatty acids protein-like [Diabrotica virgifera virgifera]XP_050499390.1 elongation of very long chain fatty acids protein-like [Diabrotica virgifera virgifera]
MAQIVRNIIDSYHDLMDNQSDPRVNDWFLMSSPFYTLAICLFYVYIVKVLGPKFMENRKPFELKKVLVIYNLFQVIFSTWLFYESCVAGWFSHYSYRCQPVDYSQQPLAMRMARGCWWYYISKFTEFFDTFFFVLRKKYDHVSTLHVIHHGVMPMSVWFGVKFTPGGHSSFFGFLNTFVHIIMYSYYLLAALGPRYQKYLWWKKYLTAIQMVQFVLVMVHAFQLLFIDCNYPKAFVWWIGMHAFMFYFLFSNFYKETYNKQKRKREEALARKQNGVHQNGVEKNGKHNIGICFTSQTALYEHSNSNGVNGVNGVSKANGVNKSNGVNGLSKVNGLNGVKKMGNGYTSEEATNLRNRTFVDKTDTTA